MGMLFLSSLAAFCGYVLLALGFPYAAGVAAASFLVILLVSALQHLVRRRRSRHGPAPVGPLSVDERAKARSKLVKGGGRTPLPN